MCILTVLTSTYHLEMVGQYNCQPILENVELLLVSCFCTTHFLLTSDEFSIHRTDFNSITDHSKLEFPLCPMLYLLYILTHPTLWNLIWFERNFLWWNEVLLGYCCKRCKSNPSSSVLLHCIVYVIWHDNDIIFIHTGVNRKVAVEISRYIEQIIRHTSVLLL